MIEIGSDRVEFHAIQIFNRMWPSYTVNVNQGNMGQGISIYLFQHDLLSLFAIQGFVSQITNQP